jgi:hypothetical protein
MSQQRMAGGVGFQTDMKNASQARGGPKLIGGGAWDQQVQRESSATSGPSAGAGSGSGYGGTGNLSSYANASKTATQSNNDFSVGSANKFTNNTRDQSNVSKQENKGFSDQRVTNNVNYANDQMDNNMARNEGFGMATTNNFVNNSKNHREDNTQKATQFANQTVDKYLAKNKNHQTTNVGALDQNIRQAPITDKAYSTVQSNNTYGDMYAYGRKELPGYSRPDSMKGVETPDFQGMYDQTKKDLDAFKV